MNYVLTPFRRMKLRPGFSLIEISLALAAGAVFLLMLIRLATGVTRIVTATRGYSQEVIATGVVFARIRQEASHLALPCSTLAGWYGAYRQSYPDTPILVPERLKAISALLFIKQPNQPPQPTPLVTSCKPRPQDLIRLRRTGDILEWSWWTDESFPTPSLHPVQVSYRCEPDAEREGFFRLVRREGVYSSENDARGWEDVLRHVASCTVSYTFARMPDAVLALQSLPKDMPQKDRERAYNAARQALRQWRTQPQWNTVEQYTLRDDQVANAMLLPARIIITCTTDRPGVGVQEYVLDIVPRTWQSTWYTAIGMRLDPGELVEDQQNNDGKAPSDSNASSPSPGARGVSATSEESAPPLPRT